MLEIIVQKWLRGKNKLFFSFLVLTFGFGLFGAMQLANMKVYFENRFSDPLGYFYPSEISVKDDAKEFYWQFKQPPKLDSDGTKFPIFLNTQDLLPLHIDQKWWQEYKVTDAQIPLVIGKGPMFNGNGKLGKKVGDILKISWNNQDYEFKIVGVSSTLGSVIPSQFVEKFGNKQELFEKKQLILSKNYGEFPNNIESTGTISLGSGTISSGKMLEVSSLIDSFWQIYFMVLMILILPIIFFGYKQWLMESKVEFLHKLGISDKKIKFYYFAYYFGLFIFAFAVAFSLNLLLLNLVSLPEKADIYEKQYFQYFGDQINSENRQILKSLKK